MQRFKHRLTLVIAVLAGVPTVGLVGCSDLGTHDLLVDGSDAVRSGALTEDGWTLTFESVVVVLKHPGLVEDIDGEPAWVREFGVTVWDVATIADPAQDGVVASRMIRAKAYDGVDFQVSNPLAGGYDATAGNVDADVVTAMKDVDRGLRVVGTAGDGMSTIAFDWTFDLAMRVRCPLGNSSFTLAADGQESSIIEIAPEQLFRGDEGMLNFDAVAAADGDGDGEVTRSELESAGLLELLGERAKAVATVRGAEPCEIFEPDVEG
ncbi:MAG: hypothetical protein KC457_17510 [Myxococcales bacterium]|nr:hypothetical protein [Myxococcales bacterium]